MRLFLPLLFFTALTAQAQTWFAPATLPVQGMDPTKTWSGGLGAPQFSEGDLNGDGLAELAVFDRQAWSWQVFERQGNGWVSAPDLAAMLPRCRNWALLRDYNHDGYADLFTDNINAVALYRNELGPGGHRVLSLAYSELISTSLSGGPLSISVLSTDVPAILDIDGDQDLDIVTFDDVGATELLHRNLSIQNSSGFDPIAFQKEPCWGKFVESNATCDLYNFNVACRPAPEQSHPIPNPQAPMHVGSSTLVFDADGDGDFDALIGDVVCSNLNLIVNGAGAMNPPLMASSTGPWPPASSGRAAGFPVFPVAFQVDIDRDGVQDLIAALNVPSSAGVGLGITNFMHNVLAYRNTGTPQAPNYQYVDGDFLQGDMIDAGSESVPVWIDIDADGDQDLIVGSHDRLYNGGLSAGLTLYRKEPAGLVKADTNLLGLLSHQGNYASPFKADFNGDGVPDLGVLVPRSFNGAAGVYIPMGSTVGADGTALNYARQDTLNFSFLPADAPAFVDYDNDGDPDMVLGRDDGSLCLVENIGAVGNPVYGPFQRGFLGMPAGIHFGCKPTVADFDQNGQPDVIVALGDRSTRLYKNPLFIRTYVSGYDSLLYQNNGLGQADLLSAGTWNPMVADDFTGDGKPDLTVGTAAGGVVLLANRNNEPLGTRARSAVQIGHLLGNPAEELGLYVEKAAQLTVRDAAGRLLLSRSVAAGASRGLLKAPASGLYLVELETAAGRQTLRWAAIQ